ncbi:unnamed protein product [Larinioides sclopetarius]|uniref:Uncharacterized protein n=1 Tax=Larinioides sclopetarius TaxID=280406 RepID=A0AAV1ZB89_9ARAC
MAMSTIFFKKQMKIISFHMPRIAIPFRLEGKVPVSTEIRTSGEKISSFLWQGNTWC